VILLGHHGHYSATWSARGDAVTPLPLEPLSGASFFPTVALGPHGREFRISIIAQDLHDTFERHNEVISNFGFERIAP
jgi:hypothetical protein